MNFVMIPRSYNNLSTITIYFTVFQTKRQKPFLLGELNLILVVKGDLHIKPHAIGIFFDKNLFNTRSEQ